MTCLYQILRLWIGLGCHTFVLEDVKGMQSCWALVSTCWQNLFLHSTMPCSSDHVILHKHKCSLCHMSYVSLSGLRAHEATHRGRYPYWCKVCGKGFPATSNLRGHMAQHTGVQSSNVTFAAASFVIHKITSDI